MPQLVTERELADEMRISVSCVRDWKARGVVGSYRVGGTTRYNLTDILNSSYLPPTK